MKIHFLCGYQNFKIILYVIRTPNEYISLIYLNLYTINLKNLRKILSKLLTLPNLHIYVKLVKYFLLIQNSKQVCC